jgi:hypothetical protein
MSKINWDQIADTEFNAMSPDYRDDWRELRDRIS